MVLCIAISNQITVSKRCVASHSAFCCNVFTYGFLLLLLIVNILLSFFLPCAHGTVLLTESNEVKLCDFGISRLITQRSGMTTAVGTPLLMAPELVRAGAAGNRDEAQANAAAIDVFSFGVLLWMLWTQQLNPYPDVDDPWRLLGMIVDGRRPPMPPPPPCARDRPSEPANASSRPISTDDADDNDCADTRTTSAQEVATSSNNDAVEADSSDHVVQQQSTSGERHVDNTPHSQMNAELGFERTWNGLPFEYAYETHAVMFN